MPIKNNFLCYALYGAFSFITHIRVEGSYMDGYEPVDANLLFICRSRNLKPVWDVP